MSHCNRHGMLIWEGQVCPGCVQESQTMQSMDSKSADATQVGGSHYKNMGMQPWDVMQAVLTPDEFLGFLKGNILKYSLRAGRKAGADDDSSKAKHYAQKLAEVMHAHESRA